MKLSIVIPAHNEEKSLVRIVESLWSEFNKHRIDNEIIIVNDNSQDNTGRIVEKLTVVYPNIIHILRQAPCGFGRALKDGFKKASGEVIIPVMADLSDEPKDVIKLYRKIEDGYDIVYGSRFRKGSKIYHYPLIKLILNRIANIIIKFIFGIGDSDITNAFKAYKREVIESISPLEATEFNITLEIPIKAHLRGFKMFAIAVNWHGRESGVSKLRLVNLFSYYREYLITLKELLVLKFKRC